MAEVFMASSEGRLLALKRILPEFSNDPMFVRMFLDEVKIVRWLSHPTICSLYDSGQVDSRPYMAMEFVPGVNLWALVRRGHPLPVELTLFIASKVALALGYAHAATDDRHRALNIVHRDVTPHNVMVSFDGKVKLLDFGVAKARVQAERTRTGVLKGKYGYMSPEQAQGTELDGRSDLFALGLVLFESLTGAPAFGGSTPSEVLDAVRSCQPQSPNVLRPDLEPALAEVVMRAVALRPADRFQTGEEMSAALDAYIVSSGRPYSEAQLIPFMTELFPKRCRAIQQVGAEVRIAIESGGAGAAHSRGIAPPVPFEDHANDLNEVALTRERPPVNEPTTTMLSAVIGRRRRRRRLRFIAMLIGVMIGLTAGVALWFILRPPQTPTPLSPIVRPLAEGER